MRTTRALILPLMALCVAPSLTSCKEDGTPTDGVFRLQRERITLENAWPNEDGREWVYDARGWESPQLKMPIFPTLEEVPGVPTLDELLATLPDLSEPGGELSPALYRVRFHGRGQTDTGAEGQVLESKFADGEWRSNLPNPLLVHLAGVRPELFGAELQKYKKADPFWPLFIDYGIWIRTPEFISFLNDLDQEPRFWLLEGDLQEGHRWSVAPIPSVAEDVVLHGQVLDTPRSKSYFGNRTSGPSVVRVFYLIDQGIHRGRDDEGSPTGYARSLLYAVVDYEANVGPVYFREFHLVFLDKDVDGRTIIMDPQVEYEGWLSHTN